MTIHGGQNPFGVKIPEILDHRYVPRPGDILTVARTLTDSRGTSVNRWVIKIRNRNTVAIWEADGAVPCWKPWSTVSLFRTVWVDSLEPSHPEAVAGRELEAAGWPEGHVLTRHESLDDALVYIGLEPCKGSGVYDAGLGRREDGTLGLLSEVS